MDSQDPQLIRVKDAQQQVETALQKLEVAVASARTDGATWQQIGDSLGISKQAASQKFQGSAVFNANAMPQIEQELRRIVDEVFTALSLNNIEQVHALMTYATARLLSKRKISRVWQDVTHEVGDFIEVQRAVTEHSGNQYVVTYRLHHERGEPVGQIAFNSRKKITGMVIYNDDSTELPW